jgi:hypothetical protein
MGHESGAPGRIFIEAQNPAEVDPASTLLRGRSPVREEA